MSGSDGLPPSNPKAGGLHLTDTEWAAVKEFLRDEPAIRRVWLYGSRLSGVRRNPGKPEPPDIDLAIDLGISDFGELVRKAAEVDARWKSLSDKHAIHFEVYEPGKRLTAIQEAGWLLVDRSSGVTGEAGVR